MIINNSLFNNNKDSNNNIKKLDTERKNKNQIFPLSIVELKNLNNSKKGNIFLTESINKKKKVKINLSEDKNKSFFRNNKIIYNFYTDYMRRQKQKELLESKLFKQKLISQFLKYSPSYLKKYETKIEENIQKDKQILEQLKAQ